MSAQVPHQGRTCGGLGLALGLLAATAACRGGPVPADKLGAFQVPRMAKPPTIDGTIDPDEWRGALAIGGLAQQNPGGNLLIMRPTTYFLAWDADHLYLACRTWIMPGLKPGAPGRTPNSATAFDPGMELNLKPMGRNVPQNTGDQSFKFFINTMGATGDMCRVAVGVLIKNWLPDFRRAWRLTAPGTAPLGGRWWECEVAFNTKDFELTGPNRAGDQWRVLLAFNHLPGWMQAAVPINGGYFDSSGWPTLTLADDAPAVQVTMDELPGIKDGQAAVRFGVFNPTAAAVEVKALAEYVEQGKSPAPLLRKEQVLKVEPGKSAEWALNEKFPRDLGANPASLYYLVTQGDKVLYRYYCFFELGYGKNWVESAKPQAAYPLSTQFNPVRNNLLIQADTYYLDDPAAAGTLRYRIARAGQGQAVLEGSIPAIRDYYFSQLLSLPALTPGEYVVQTTMAMKDGKEVGPVATKFTKKDEAKEFAAWWHNKLGDTERLIPPFTALQASDSAVSLLGRQYTLGALGLPSAVASGGLPVLSGPVRLVVVAGGREQVVPLTGKCQITESKPWRVSFKGEAQGAGLRFTAAGTLEQDGLCLVDLTYAPAGAGPVKLDALRVEWPLADDDMNLLICIGSGGNFSPVTARSLDRRAKGRLWSTLETGRGGSLMAVGSFYPEVWIGNERRGLLWTGDSDRGWVPNNDVPAHEVVRTDTELVLRNHIVAEPFELIGPRTVTFGCNATPFKPMPKGWRLAIHSEDGTFGGAHKERIDPKTNKKIEAVQYICPPAFDPAEWSDVWAQHKPKADEKVRALQPFDPAAARNKDYVHTSVALMGWGPLTYDENVAGYFAPEWGDNTHGAVQRDYLIWLLDRSYREGGIRTNYWDIFYVSLFPTVQNGMAYELPDGRIQPGFNTLNLRKLMMRQRALQADCGLEPGGMVTHSTNAYPLVAFPWIDALLNGEWAELTDSSTRDWVDSFPDEYHMAMSTPEAFGVSISWMNLIHIKDEAHRGRVFRGFMDWVRFHDCSWYWQDGVRPPEPALEWGLNDPRLVYVPYWRNDAIKPADKDVLVAAWRLPDRVMVMAFNRDAAAAKDARLTVDFKALGMAAKAPWDGAYVIRELRGGKPSWIEGSAADPAPTLAGQTVTVAALAPHTARCFGLRVQEQADVDRLTAQYRQFLAATKGDSAASAPLPEALGDWGLLTPGAEFKPLGQAQHVTCPDADLAVAMWRLPDRVVLALASKAAKDTKDFTLKVDLDKLGLTPQLPWQEFVRVKTFGDGPAATLNFPQRELLVPKLPAGAGRLIGLRRY